MSFLLEMFSGILLSKNMKYHDILGFSRDVRNPANMLSYIDDEGKQYFPLLA